MSDIIVYRETDWLCPRCCSWSDGNEEPPYQYCDQEMHLDCAVAAIAEDMDALQRRGGRPLEEARGILRDMLAALGVGRVPPNPETTPHDVDACKREPCSACYWGAR